MAVPLSSYKTPGVYVQEIQKLPPSIAQVDTAVPVFIGYTEKAEKDGESLIKVPTRVTSMDQYVRWFGGPHQESLAVSIDGEDINTIKVPLQKEITFRMYYAAQMFFDNGGGVCFVISIGETKDEDGADVSISYIRSSETDTTNSLDDGIELLYNQEEPTLIVFPDAVPPSPSDPSAEGTAASYISLYEKALGFCANPKINNYFVLMDVGMESLASDTPLEDAAAFRDITNDLELVKYGAAYYPFVATSFSPNVDDSTVTITGLPEADSGEGDGGDGDSGDGGDGGDGGAGDGDGGDSGTESSDDATPVTLADIKESNNQIYNSIRDLISSRTRLILPPSGTMAGIYARVDSQSGVFKAPANVGLINVVAPTVKVADKDHDSFNIDTTGGKSINVIRTFKGIGTLVWGARTLAGNDREWKYISVRRFFNMVEESVKRALFRFVFEPNNPNTWTSIRASIEAFLETQWRAGALLGNTPSDAYSVRVGVPETFSEAEMLDGYMVVEIGMAVVRPAEFIVLKFMHKFELGQ